MVTDDGLVEAVALCAREHDAGARASQHADRIVATFGSGELSVVYLQKGSWKLTSRLVARDQTSRWSVESRFVWFPEKLGPRASVPALDAKYKVFAVDPRPLAEPRVVAALVGISSGEHFKATCATGWLSLTWSLIHLDPGAVTDRKPVLIPRVRTLLALGRALYA